MMVVRCWTSSVVVMVVLVFKVLDKVHVNANRE